jgi:hypothetical protein
MNRELKVLLANMRRMKETQRSIPNDEELSDYSILAVTEPYLYLNREERFEIAPRTHTHWTPVIPEGEERLRAMIWI